MSAIWVMRILLAGFVLAGILTLWTCAAAAGRADRAMKQYWDRQKREEEEEELM